MKKTLFTFIILFSFTFPVFAANAIHGPYWMEGKAPNPTVEWLDRERTWRNNMKDWWDDWYNDSYYSKDLYTYEYSYVLDPNTGLYHLLLKTIKNGSEESLKEFMLDSEDFNIFTRLVSLPSGQGYKLENYDDPLYLQRYKRIINSLVINYHIVDEETYSMEIYIE